ncbi:hypothetical protein BH24ACT8_BH24ACT8_18060 [soil metagenome]
MADLGGRNTLLWYRDLPTGTFDLTVAHPGGVAKLLAGVGTLLSELVRESIAFAEARRRVSAIRAKTVELHREHGMTTGFIAVGMASWQLRRAPVAPRAPVLLRGCDIEPTDASYQDFSIRLQQDVVFNPVLEHYLRGEVGLDFDPEELAGLSTRGNGFDPRPTYRALEELCAGVVGFGIGPQMVISTFPWAKLPLVAEFAESPARWAASDIVAALAGWPLDLPGRALDVADPSLADDPSVLDADRAQRAVVAAAGQGSSLVVDAAPGTGRTQTVANLVAAAVLDGRRVLVLAEHRTALQALHSRLSRVGLEHLLLTLRETPQGRRAVVADLLTSLQALEGSTEPQVPDDPVEDLVGCSARLGAHERAMHEQHQPWGTTQARAQVELTVLASRQRPPLSHVRLAGPPLEKLLPDRVAEVKEALVRAATIGVWQRGRSEDPWYGAALADRDQAHRAGDIVQRMVRGELARARDLVVQVCAEAGLPEPLNLKQWDQYLELMGRVRETLDVFRPQVYEAPLGDLVAATAKGRGEDRPSAVARGRLRRQVRGLLRPGSPPADLADRVLAARTERTQWEALAGRAARPTTPATWEQASEAFEEIHEDLTWLGSVLESTTAGRDLRTTHLDLLLDRLLRLEARDDRLQVAADAHQLLQPLRDAGLAPLVDDLARRGVASEDVTAEVDLVFWASLLDRMGEGEDAQVHNGAALRADEEAFAEADRQHLRANAARVLGARHRRAVRFVAANPELVATLRALGASSVTPHTRDALGPVAELAQALRPCWVGSPLVVPATVPEDVQFDLVVVDEAARVPLAHAVPGLARGAQVVAFGDSSAVPPQPFAAVVDERAEGDAAQPLTARHTVLHALSDLLPVLHLDNHYRSIDQRLVVPLAECGPAHPAHAFPGVLRSPRVTHLRADTVDGVIVTVVDQVIQHARVTPWQSLAVLAHDAALADDIDRALRARIVAAGLGRSFREDAVESLLLTTMARAGGEARDRVILALAGHGAGADLPHAASALSVARRSVTVVTDRSLAHRTDSPGLHLLQTAVKGALANPEHSEDTSPLLAELAGRLRVEGLTVREGYGVGPHAIEIVVDDAEEPGRPLLAIQTDSRPSDPAPTRDGLRIRPEQLGRLGWTPVRVWSTDLFRDPAREVARLVDVGRRASAARSRR